MMKMDIEGHEEAAIRGCHLLLSKPSLKVIELETTTSEIEGAFAQHGFSQYFYDPFKRSFPHLPRHSARQMPSL